MVFQAQPTTQGVYRVKVYGNDSNAYWKYIPDATPWVQLAALDESSNQFKWSISPVHDQPNTFIIKPTYDSNILLGTSSGNTQKYWGYGLPVGITSGSPQWKIIKKTVTSAYSKVYYLDNPYVIDSRDTESNVVHFYQDQDTDAAKNQRYVFQLVNDTSVGESSQQASFGPSKKPRYLERRAIVPQARAVGFMRDSNTPDVNNVQGDIYYMFPKRFERFIFFTISNLAQFRQDLDTYRPRVTSSKQTMDTIDRIDNNPGGDLDIVSSQIAFSKAGLRYLGQGQRLGDVHFDNGSMRKEKDILGDKEQWDPVFDKGTTHGVILVTAGKKTTCENEGVAIRNIFSRSIKNSDITIMDGRVRADEGEHFGWRDGISQPGLIGLSEPRPGQRVVNPGVVIMGYPGDPVFDRPDSVQRPGFTKDGSFMVFRKLEQAVLSFEDYIDQNYTSIPPDESSSEDPLTITERKALFGARMMGRFKKGAPLALTPYRDNLAYTRSSVINNFDYTTGNTEGRPPNCPFAAHIRKTAPRNLDPLIQKEFLDASVIVRSGIPYGDDVTKAERAAWKKLTEEEKAKQTSPRGLLFACYQSSIENGFFRQTTSFANNDFFPVTSLVPMKHGQDPIIGGPQSVQGVYGQVDIPSEGQITLDVTDKKSGKPYEITGFAKANDTSLTAYKQDFFVTSRGGEYFFVPSISTLADWGASKD